MKKSSPYVRRPGVPGLKVFLLGMLVLGIALIAGAFYVVAHRGVSASAIEETILSFGAWGVLASIGLMVLHSFVPFPAEFLAIANGMVYGPVWGLVITWTGAMLGAFLAFGLARVLGRPFVEMMVAKKHWHLLDEWAVAQGWRLVLVSRFIPIISFNLINYAVGVTRISWWTFAWATGIGILPATTLMVLAGDSLEAFTAEIWLMIGAGALALWFVFRDKYRPRNSKESNHVRQHRARSCNDSESEEPEPFQ